MEVYLYYPDARGQIGHYVPQFHFHHLLQTVSKLGQGQAETN